MGYTGFTPSDFAEPEVEAWPENWPALQLFIRYSSQWRMSMAGPVGLDYSVILSDLERRGITEPEYTETFDRLQIIEQVALEHIHRESK